ncbi:MAG: hypothetical protein GF350_00845, partial [Chitinivibrionales bacterium]|nr:hypothetical protein [Chitinivibrionales bacterium]
MRAGINKTDYVLWSFIAIYTGIIYATLSLVSKIRKVLAEKYGVGVFNNIYWIFILAGAGVLVWCCIRFKGIKRLKAVGAFIVIGSIYTYYLTTLTYAVEKIHFVEYGLLALLVGIAVTRHIPAWPGTGIALCIVFWIGLGDETIQWALPNRVGEIRDSITNLISGALGISLLPMLRSPRTAAVSIPAGHVRAFIASIGTTVIFTALFLLRVHGFGHVVE